MFLLTFIISCSPQNYLNREKVYVTENAIEDSIVIINEEESIEESIIDINKLEFIQTKILNEVEILLPKSENYKVTKDFINAFELSLYTKDIKNIKLNINLYSNKKDLDNIISQKTTPGKIFIGPLTSADTENLIKECSKGVLFFSFASNRKYAGECIYLINFFPEDDLITLFDSFDPNSKIVLLYPENNYGYYINSIIDQIAIESNSIIINRASYKEDLTNARDAIKELGKYELRKYELERQKTILKAKNDEVSKKALKKIERFETTGIVDFTHIILPDYSIRLLQIAPLLPFYDIDPNKVQFVGTGVWDNNAFFNEPSLQRSIFPGIVQSKRNQYIDNFYSNYKEEPTRTVTLPHDIIGILAYIINNKLKLEEVYKLLNNESTVFDGIDGKFSFINNIISRDLNILRISNGEANLVK